MTTIPGARKLIPAFLQEKLGSTVAAIPYSCQGRWMESRWEPEPVSVHGLGLTLGQACNHKTLNPCGAQTHSIHDSVTCWIHCPQDLGQGSISWVLPLPPTPRTAETVLVKKQQGTSVLLRCRGTGWGVTLARLSGSASVWKIGSLLRHPKV